MTMTLPRQTPVPIRIIAEDTPAQLLGQSKKILIIDTDCETVEHLTGYCRAEGYQIASVSDGFKALPAFKSEKQDLVLLDLALPGLDGMEVCRRLRNISKVPIIIVSGRCDEVDRVLGLETGADDFVTKPFSPRELMARIRVTFRRLQEFRDERRLEVEEPQIQRRMIRAGRLQINLDTREVVYNSQIVEQLTNKEFELLTVLARYPGRIYSKSELEEALYDCDSLLERGTIRVFISNLRNKLPQPDLVETVYGVGYRLSCEYL